MRLSLRLFLTLVCSCSCLVTFFFLILFKTKNQGDMIRYLGQLKKDPRPKVRMMRWRCEAACPCSRMIGRGHRAQGLEEGTNRTPEHHQVRVVAGAPFAVALVQRSRKEVALCLITLGISQDELGEGCRRGVGCHCSSPFLCNPFSWSPSSAG